MKNPCKKDNDEWRDWEIHNDRKIRNDKLIEDMKQYIYEKVLSVRDITFKEDGNLEVGIFLDDRSEYYELITLKINSKKYFKWLEKPVELEKNVTRESDNEIVNLIIGKYTKLQMENIYLKRKIKKLSKSQ